VPLDMTVKYFVLDVHCGPCEPTTPTRRLARFVRPASGGEISFQIEGHPKPHRRADGGRTWVTETCPCGHRVRLREERISAALDTIQPGPDGSGSLRVFL